jgi:ADP-ribose pyrophosphatase
MRREYPDQPIPTVCAVVFNDDCVLLVQRSKDPNRGRWTLPGGAIELGETVRQAIEREVREECGIAVKAGEVVAVLDVIQPDEAGQLRFHYVLIDLACEYISGDLTAGDDAADVRWVHPAEFDALDVPQRARAIITKASFHRKDAKEVKK